MYKQIIALIFLMSAWICCISAAGKCQLVQEQGDDGRSIAYSCVEVTFAYVKNISDQADKIDFIVSKLHIPEKAFARFSLRALSFHKCDIKYIDPKAFEGLTSLQRLTFWKSNVHVLPASWFRGMHSLTYLSLQMSKLVYIEPKTFLEIPNLRYLNIADNDLNCLPEHALTPLRRLKHVRIKENPWLCNCHAELVKWMLNRDIDFGAKNMSSVEFECMSEVYTTEAIQHQSVSEVAQLTVNPGGSCRSKTLPALLTFPDNSEVIRLSSTQISTIPEFAFFQFGNSLKSLDLSNCNISDIHSEALAGLPKLKQLNLFNNSISTIKSEWFRDLRSLKRLSLNGNRIKSIESNVFPLLDKIEVLNLEHNSIKCLPIDSFSLMKNLKILDIGKNPWDCTCLQDFIRWLSQQPIQYSVTMGRCTHQSGKITDAREGSKVWNNSSQHSFVSETRNHTESHATFTQTWNSSFTGSKDLQFQNEVEYQRKEIGADHPRRVNAIEQPRRRRRREAQRNVGQGCPQRQQISYHCPFTCKKVSTRFIYECVAGTISGLNTVADTAETIMFRDSAISIVYNSIFRRFGSYLRILQFLNCRIETIEPNAFAGLDRLQELILQGNNIHEVQASWFRDTINLQRLILTKNYITRIENNFFYVLPNLEHLDISDNQLNCIATDLIYHISKLTTIDVHRNPWTCLCRKKLIELLDDLNLRYNPSIQTEYLDWSCVDVTRPVTATNPTRPPTLPPPRPTVTTTGSTGPPTLPPPSFTTSRPFTTLAPLTAVCGGRHCGTIQLRPFHCRCVGGEDAFVLEKISNYAERIEIIDSTLLNITAELFSRFSGLEELVFVNCTFGTIDPAAFRGLHKLKLLQFRNSSVSVIKSSWFYDLTSLTELDLAGNHITEIEGDTFQYLSNLRILSLSDNNIGCIYTKSLNGAKHLEQIMVHDNPWKWRCMEELTQFFKSRNITYSSFRTHLGEPITCELKWDGTSDVQSGSTNASISTVNVLCVSLAMLIFTKF